jgi:uncharacterized iron-regulated membrane protein
MVYVILKLHTWAGLATFVNLMIYGIVGIAAAFEPAPDAPAPAAAVREIPFAMPQNSTDREVAEQVVERLGLSLATPVQNFAIQHDDQHRLVLDFRHANGRHRITFPDAGHLQVEITRAPLDRYLSSLHVTSAVFHSGDWRMQAWSWYNEFAMWCLIFMILSGAWLWLSRRARHRWALASLAAGAGVFTLMYWWTRLA